MVHFVGAGCGAPDLITLRGHRLLSEADVVIYAGSLVNPALLEAVKPGCEIHDSAGMTLEEVFAVMRAAEAGGKTTVRLHTGDPALYGAIREQIDLLKEAGIENILALRGDYPEGYDPAAPRDFRYAYELVKEITAYGGFCIGGACYPEGHVECLSQAEDLRHLKEKVDCGVDFLTTQMFFDNSALYSFLYRAQEVGINVPI